MNIVPIHLKQANDFVKEHHRHNKPVTGHKFAIGLEAERKLVGVGIAGRPVSRYLDDGKTIELTRICVKEGVPNGCSMIIGRMKRIAQLMGYERIITYTLQKETGAWLRAIRAKGAADVKPGRGWSHRPGSKGHQAVYDEPKIRWEL